MIRLAATALCAFALATTAHADVYQLDFTGVIANYPVDDPPSISESFSFDTGTLYNTGFEEGSGFSCGTGGSDCFVAQFTGGDGGPYVLVNRNGTIEFTDYPAYDSYINPYYDFGVPLFTGSDDAPQLITGTFAAGYQVNYHEGYTGTATLTDETTSPVPEPASLALLGTGLLGGLAAVRRRFS